MVAGTRKTFTVSWRNRTVKADCDNLFSSSVKATFIFVLHVRDVTVAVTTVRIPPPRDHCHHACIIIIMIIMMHDASHRTTPNTMKSNHLAFRKRLLFIPTVLLVLPVVIVTWIVQRRQGAWERTVSLRVQNLLSASVVNDARTRVSSSSPAPPPAQPWSEVPPPVQHYLTVAFRKSRDESGISILDKEPSPSVRHRSVSYVQRGDFLLQEGLWFPYEATETLTSEGFVWVASMSALEHASDQCRSGSASGYHCALFDRERPVLTRWLKAYVEPLLTVWIVDAFSLREPSFALISWMKGVKTVVDSAPPTPEFAAQLERGEVVRWLATLAMLPTAWLPSSGKVRWTEHADDSVRKAILEVNVDADSDLASVRLTATFDPTTGFLMRLEGDRPYLERGTKTFRVRSWVGTFREYRWNDDAQVWHPTAVEAGWMSENGETPVPTLSLAVRANQTRVHYQLENLGGK